MKLYQFGLSPNAKRVRVIAQELGIACEAVNLDFTKGEHKTPSFLAKNPNGKVPTIEDGNVTLWESTAILAYYAAKYPQKNLLPTDPYKHADVLRWMFWNASHLEASVFSVAVEKFLKPMMGQQPDQAKVEAGLKEWNRFAPVLNAQLEGKTWITGDTYTIADIALGTTVEFGAQVECSTSAYPHLDAWYKRLTARDTWKRA